MPPAPVVETPDLEVADATVSYDEPDDLLIFELRVRGTAGATLPHRRGALNGAPFLAYVFPTSLSPAAVGFRGIDGQLALAIAAHPDFDDTPLWDENGDGNPSDDGAVWHAHWIVLAPDERAAGGEAVAEARGGLPPTAPDLGLAIDSPGFSVVRHGDTLRVLVPAERVGHQTDFSFDAAAASLQLSTAPGTPKLALTHEVAALSGAQKLPHRVKRK